MLPILCKDVLMMQNKSEGKFFEKFCYNIIAKEI